MNVSIIHLGNFEDIGALGIIGKVGDRYRNDTMIHINAQFFSEACGGPVLNSNNEVVGVAASGTEFFVEDKSTAFSSVISSSLIQTLIANSEKVIPLVQWQKYSIVRTHVLEANAEEKAPLYDNRGALRDYNKALKLNPDLVGIYTRRGRIKLRMGKIIGTIRDFNKAIKINPQDIISYNNRASAKGEIGDEDGMLADLNQALHINPNYILGLINRGQVKCQIAESKMDKEDITEAKRLYQEAIDDFIKVLELNQKHSFARKRFKNVRQKLKALN